jgi:tRNA(adenine34) deaminase
MPENTSDTEFMRAALAEAREAAERGEVPIGAVLARDSRIIARAGNRTISDCDPTAHAEIVALRAASKIIGNYRLLCAVAP